MRFKPRLPTNYAESTHGSPHWIVRHAHLARYRLAAETVRDRCPGSLLDYGAGDGHLLTEALLAEELPSRVVAFEPVAQYVQELHTNLARAGISDRVRVVTDRASLLDQQFDVITCLGVLEHMPLPERQVFYSLCDAGLGTNGVSLIDVPVETGPTLLVKHLGRTKLKGRESEYRRRELLRLALGGTAYDPGRFDPTDSRTWITHHKGFDYRLFRQEIEHRFRIVSTNPTPISWLPPWLGNQEIFFLIARP